MDAAAVESDHCGTVTNTTAITTNLYGIVGEIKSKAIEKDTVFSPVNLGSKQFIFSFSM